MDTTSKVNPILPEEYSEEAPKYLLPHMELIFKCAYRMTGQRCRAEDLTQDAFYYAYKNFVQLKDREKAKSWLFSILRNLFLKEIERSKRRTFVDYDSLSQTLGDSTNIEKEFLKNETNECVRELLDTLEPRLRQPLELFYFEKKAYKEIASELELPIGTVMSRIARAKVYLKRRVDHSDKFEI